MSDTTTASTATTIEPTEPAEPNEATEATELVTPEDPDATEPDDTSRNANKEAARYRRQLREAEAERDQLRTQLDAVRRAEVDRLIAAQGVQPAAVWAHGATLEALLRDDGTVDPQRVDAAVTATRDAFGIRPGWPGSGQGKRESMPTEDPFVAAFRPPR